jgi:uncharacterized protein (TIGR02246 family)
MRLSRTLVPLLGLAALAACAKAGDDTRMEAESPGTLAPPATDPAAVRRVIDSTNALLIEALNKEDAAAQSALYTPDGMVMLSGMPAWKGRAGIEENAKGMFDAMDLKDAKFTTDNVEVSGDLAVETGTYSMTVVPKGAKAMPDAGKYITVWKRQSDGTWKIYRDISNSDTEKK